MPRFDVRFTGIRFERFFQIVEYYQGEKMIVSEFYTFTHTKQMINDIMFILKLINGFSQIDKIIFVKSMPIL